MGKNFLQKITFLLFIITPITVIGADKGVDPFTTIRSRVRKVTLKNGLRLIMVPRPQTPIVSFAVAIRTGGVDDDFGRSGMAHMFEHMLFKGSKTVGTINYKKEIPILKQLDKAAAAIQKEKDEINPDPRNLEALQKKLEDIQKKHEELIEKEEFWTIYERAGGRGLNAGTGYDYTYYTVSLPKNRIKLWMKMESDRIQSPVLREFYKERDVVLEERRNRVDDSPRGKMWESFGATAFQAHPYGRPLIGWEDEISRLTRSQARQFFKKHYDVSRLVVTIVGGFDPDDVEKMVRTHFESIPSQITSYANRLPIEPEQKGERRVDVEFDAEPSLLIGYKRPNFKSSDNAALEVLSDVLGTGRTSRIYKSIVQKKRLATKVWSSSSGSGEREPTLFVFGGSPNSPHTTKDLEAALYEEIEKIQEDGPTEQELTKVKNLSLDYLIRSLSSNSGMAQHLAYYEAVAGDWEYLLRIIKSIQNVTADDVKRVANQYLIKSKRTVATLVRTKK